MIRANTEVGWTCRQLDEWTDSAVVGQWDELGVVLGHSNG